MRRDDVRVVMDGRMVAAERVAAARRLLDAERAAAAYEARVAAALDVGAEDARWFAAFMPDEVDAALTAAERR